MEPRKRDFMRACLRKKLLSAAIASVAALACLVTRQSRATQPRPAQAVDEAKGALTLLYYGTVVCIDCHRDPKNVKGEPPVLCRCDEVKTWELRDKHGIAYQVLTGDRAKQMGKLLGIPNVTLAKECLSCHGVVIPDKRSQHESFKAQEGVSCVICHGP